MHCFLYQLQIIVDKLAEYILPVQDLPTGNHEFNFKLDDGFFAAVEGEIEHGDIDADIHIFKSNLDIEAQISLTGTVETQCDRCLDPMDVDVDVEDTLHLRFGKEYSEEDGNVIVLPEDEGVWDVSWLLYEYVMLSIPMRNCHPDGECNPEMAALLKKYSVDETDEKTEDTDGENGENNKVDPRWAALKNILNN